MDEMLVDDELEVRKVEVKREDTGLMVQDRKGAVLSYRELKDLERETDERLRKEYEQRYGVSGSGNQYRNPVPLGTRFEEALNQKFTDEVMGNLIGKMFGGSPVANKGGIVSGIMGEPAIVNMLGNIGLGIGNNFDKIIEKAFGLLGRGAAVALAKKAGVDIPEGSEGQTSITPEQQKKMEDGILNINPNDNNAVGEFMNMVNSNSPGSLKNVEDSRNMLKSVQHEILVRRGLISEVPNEVVTRDNSRKHDMNRDLIDRYDKGIPAPGGGSNDFFNQQSGGGGMGVGVEQSPEEIILSMNPDDPQSIHQYAAMRNLIGVDVVSTKKMLINEQRSLLGKNNIDIRGKNPSDVPISPNDDIGQKDRKKVNNEFLVEIPPDQREKEIVGNKEEVDENVVDQPSDNDVLTKVLEAVTLLNNRISDYGNRLELLESKKEKEKTKENKRDDILAEEKEEIDRIEIPPSQKFAESSVESVTPPLQENIPEDDRAKVDNIKVGGDIEEKPVEKKRKFSIHKKGEN